MWWLGSLILSGWFHEWTYVFKLIKLHILLCVFYHSYLKETLSQRGFLDEQSSMGPSVPVCSCRAREHSESWWLLYFWQVTLKDKVTFPADRQNACPLHNAKLVVSSSWGFLQYKRKAHRALAWACPVSPHYITWLQRSTNNTLFMWLAVLRIMKFFFSNPGVPCLLTTFTELWLVSFFK